MFSVIPISPHSSYKLGSTNLFLHFSSTCSKGKKRDAARPAWAPRAIAHDAEEGGVAIVDGEDRARDKSTFMLERLMSTFIEIKVPYP